MNPISSSNCSTDRAAANPRAFRSLWTRARLFALCVVPALMLGISWVSIHAQNAHFVRAQGGIVNAANTNVANPGAVAADSRTLEITSTNGNFGTVNVGSTRPAPIAMIFTFDAAETLGSTAVVTQGVTGLDFTDAGTGSCKAGTAYSTGNTCTVNVNFTPKFAGTRYGAANLLDGSGNVLATGYLQGTGVGPQVNFLPGIQSVVAKDSATSGDPFAGDFAAVAVDGSGNVYIVDFGFGRLLKETPSAGGYTTSIISSSLSEPIGVAVDGSGNVYVQEEIDQVLKETPSASGYTQSVVATIATSGQPSLEGIAVDGSGNVFITDVDNNQVLKETLSASGYTQSVVANAASNGLNVPQAVAVDGSGSIYIVDWRNSRVLKETPSASGYTQSVIADAANNGLSSPESIAVDGSGNVYIGDANDITGAVRVLKETLAAGSYIQSVIPASIDVAWGVAVDGSGNIYIVDSANYRVVKEDFADPPSLAFVPTAVGAISTDSPKTVTVSNNGNAALAFPLPATGDNPSISENFTLNSGEASACPVVASDSPQTGMLGVGSNCLLSISFTPTVAGTLSGTLALTDTNLNAAAPSFATQTVQLSGTALQEGGTGSKAAAELIAPALGSALSGPSVTFSWTQGTGVTEYEFLLGSTGAGSSNLYNGSPTTALSAAAIGSPTNGATIYARLLSLIDGVWQYWDYTFPSWKLPTGDFGVLNVGSTSSTPVLLQFASAATLGSIAVVTQGAPGLDFANVGTGTCKVGLTYLATYACTVVVSFTPKFAGSRYGAVELLDGSGNVQATAYVQGTGIGPQVSFQPGTESIIATSANGLFNPSGVAVDGSGNIYIANRADGQLLKETPSAGGYTQSILPPDGLYYSPWAVAVDGSGSLYIADDNNMVVVKATLSGGSYSLSFVAGGFSYPTGVAVDGSGNVYIADNLNNQVLKETPSAGGYTQTVVADAASNGLNNPYGVAVDGSGNVYIADSGNSRVLKETLSMGSYTQSVVADSTTNGLSDTTGVAVDGSGNLYVTDGRYNQFDPEGSPNTSRLLKETLSAGGYTQSVLHTSELFSPEGVTVDSSGNAFIADVDSSRILKEDFADPPSLTFAATAVGVPSADSPKTVLVSNDGNGALTFPLPAAGDNPSVPANFAWDPSSTCVQTTPGSSTAFALAEGVSCSMAFDFKPTTTGSLSGLATLTDNNLNVTGAMQGIQLTGLQSTQVITFPQPASVYYGSAPVTLSATSGASGNPVIFSLVSGPGSLSGANDSVLAVTGWGTIVIAANEAGNADYAAAPQITRNVTALFSKDAALTSPTPGSTLTGPSATFTWSPGLGPTEYMLYLGSTGVNSKDIYDSGATTATSVNVTDLPINGEKIYARLYSLIGGDWHCFDYTFTAAALQATLISPTPGSTLPGSNVRFTWSAGEGVTKYALFLGTNGIGNNNPYNSGETTATSVNVTGLPVNGEKIYARLYSLISGVWYFLDYTYTAE